LANNVAGILDGKYEVDDIPSLVAKSAHVSVKNKI
jgi:glycerol-3-phosphate dehydrogenase (NAD+)